MHKHTSIQLFRYEPTAGVAEYHAIFRITNPRLTYAEQVDSIQSAYELLVKEEIPGAVAVLKRYFLSDAANQSHQLLATQIENSDCALSIVERQLSTISQSDPIIRREREKENEKDMDKGRSCCTLLHDGIYAGSMRRRKQ